MLGERRAARESPDGGLTAAECSGREKFGFREQLGSNVTGLC